MGRKRKTSEEPPVEDSIAKVFRIEKFYNFLKTTSRAYQVVCLFGGAGSGKSEAICQELVDRFFNEDDIYILVVRRSGPSLTASTYEMVLRIIRQYGYVENVDYFLNKTEKSIRTRNNVMWFKALDDPEKIKSLNLNYVYLEEATEVKLSDFQQLTWRCRNRNKAGTNQVILSFNPVSPYHWTKTAIVDKADYYERSDYEHPNPDGSYPLIQKHITNRKYIAVQHSSYLDNPFVNYGDTVSHYKENDDAMYQIYGLGEFVQLSNLIYTRYNTVSSVPTDPPTAIGLDFGWHRTAMVAVWHDGRSYEVTIKELLYAEKITTKEIAEAIDAFPPSWAGVTIYADSARPDQIEELQRLGYRVEPAKKDVKAGIDMVKRFYLHITEDSHGLLKELPTYKWKERQGEVLEEPVKINDHGCDAMRYAIFSSEIAEFVLQEVFSTKTLENMKSYAHKIPRFNSEESPMYQYDIPSLR